jgi:hypothetical protein
MYLYVVLIIGAAGLKGTSELPCYASTTVTKKLSLFAYSLPLKSY